MYIIFIIIALIIFGLIIKKGTKNKKLSKKAIILMLIIAAIIVLIGTVLIPHLKKHKYDKLTITDGYYAVLKGESGEVIYNTYLYINNNNKKVEYYYIQSESRKESSESTEMKEKITGKGNLDYPQDVIDKAKENKSAEYAILNVNIEETAFQTRHTVGDMVSIEELYNLIAIK